MRAMASSEWSTVAVAGVLGAVALVGFAADRDASPLVAGVVGVLLVGILFGRTARPRALLGVAAVGLLVAAVLEGAPPADPSRVSVVVGAAAVSALLLVSRPR